MHRLDEVQVVVEVHVRVVADVFDVFDAGVVVGLEDQPVPEVEVAQREEDQPRRVDLVVAELADGLLAGDQTLAHPVQAVGIDHPPVHRPEDLDQLGHLRRVQLVDLEQNPALEEPQQRLCGRGLLVDPNDLVETAQRFGPLVCFGLSAFPSDARQQ